VIPPSRSLEEGSRSLPAGRDAWAVSVVICAYTEDRWPLLLRSVASVQAQSQAPEEIILCVDHNEALFERCRGQWADQTDDRSSVPVRVLANKYEGRLGSARNTGTEIACGDIVAFLDDDACADPTWLQRLIVPYDDPSVVAVGGAPLPEFEGSRPPWFPFEFDWVFGCAYAGLPEKQAPVLRLIGANMSVRRGALTDIGGFHSDNHDDMDMCHRLKHHRPSDQLVYEPMAQVQHFVPAVRTSWGYFWRRCFFVNKGKVEAQRQMENAGNLSADVSFVGRALSRGVSKGLRQALRGDAWGAARAGAIVAGIVLAGSGHVVGTWRWHRIRGRRSLGASRPTAGMSVADQPPEGHNQEPGDGREAWFQSR
jgi:GT2 family glycosyltransferase